MELQGKLHEIEQEIQLLILRLKACIELTAACGGLGPGIYTGRILCLAMQGATTAEDPEEDKESSESSVVVDESDHALLGWQVGA